MSSKLTKSSPDEIFALAARIKEEEEARAEIVNSIYEILMQLKEIDPGTDAGRLEQLENLRSIMIIYLENLQGFNDLQTDVLERLEKLFDEEARLN